MPAPSKPAPAPAQDESRYPTVERFIERATPEEVGSLFGDLRDQLGAVKGPKAEHAKKAEVAVQRAEELFGHLVDVRERLISEQKSAKRRK